MLQLALASLFALTASAAPAPPVTQSPDAASQLVPAAGPPAPSPAMDEYEDASPPEGSPAEVALWQAGMDATRGVWHSRAASATLRNQLFQLDLVKRLERAAAEADHEGAERLQKVRKQLQAAELRNYEIFKRRWTIDPYRACGYPQLNYDSAMRTAPGPNRQAEVSGAAADLKSCIDRASVPVAAMKEANVALAAALQAAQRALAAAVPGKPSAREAHEAHERHEAQEKAAKAKKE